MSTSRTAALAAILALCGCSDNTSDELDGKDDEFLINGGKTDSTNGIEEWSYDAFCVLTLVNSATEQTLHDGVSLSRSVSRAIPANRPYEDLEDLDRVPWVGYFTFNALLNYARNNGMCPDLGEEYQFPDEDGANAEIARMIRESVESRYAEGGRPSRRDAHAKHHGCVKATFEVQASNLPTSLRVGLFARDATYQAWVRFSNGDFRVQDDTMPDGRGMAIKVMGVPGDKLLDEERTAQTQDFVMINGPVFFVRNVHDYIEFSELSPGGIAALVSYFLSLNPLEWRLRELSVVLGLASTKPSNPLLSQYFSMTPYKLGPEAIKFSAVPCGGPQNGRPLGAGPNYLREAMASTLANEDACFRFMVQRQVNPRKQPIEDPTVVWAEQLSPFTTVATLHIPAQAFDTPAQQTFCEHLSFTPWHSLPEHKPLGSINRTRKTVYQIISKLRHSLNNAPRQEPTDWTVPGQ